MSRKGHGKVTERSRKGHGSLSRETGWLYNPPGHHPTTRKLFWHFQRSYPQVLYLFGNLSWPPTWIPTQLPKFCNFFATHFCKLRIWKLPEVLPPSVIPFWKPLMTPNLDPNSDAKFCKFFHNQFLCNPNTNTSKDPSPNVIPFWNIDLTLYFIPSSLNLLHPFPLP